MEKLQRLRGLFIRTRHWKGLRLRHITFARGVRLGCGTHPNEGYYVMFENLLRELAELQEGTEISVKIQIDNDGYFDRCCPSQICGAHFKILFADWRAKVGDDVAYCPMCRHTAAPDKWCTPAQDDYLQTASVCHLLGRIDDAMVKGIRRFNSSQPKQNAVTLSASYRPGSPIAPVPPEAQEKLRQRFVCERCSCRYSALGAAFFCPACGHNSAISTFAQAVEAVRASIRSLETIRAAIEVSSDADAAANAVRYMLENGLIKLVASFERFAEATFQALPCASTQKFRKNLFQNLAESSKLWMKATGSGYETLIAPTEYAELQVLFQQRHLLAHREGIVDQQYIDITKDYRYTVGRKVIVKERTILRLADLVERLADRLTTAVQGAVTTPLCIPVRRAATRLRFDRRSGRLLITKS